MIEALSKIGMEGNFLKFIRDTYQSPTVNIFNGKILNAFS